IIAASVVVGAVEGIASSSTPSSSSVHPPPSSSKRRHHLHNDDDDNDDDDDFVNDRIVTAEKVIIAFDRNDRRRDTVQIVAPSSSPSSSSTVHHPHKNRIRLLYFLFRVSTAIPNPFMTLYMKHVGLDAASIGKLQAIRPVVTMMCAPLWGGLADGTGRRKSVLMTAFLLSFLCRLSARVLSGNVIHFAISLCVTSAFYAPVSSLLDSIVVSSLGEHDKVNFGRLRLWGELGSGVASSVMINVINREDGMGFEYMFLLHAISSVIALISMAYCVPTSATMTTTSTAKATSTAEMATTTAKAATTTERMYAEHGMTDVAGRDIGLYRVFHSLGGTLAWWYSGSLGGIFGTDAVMFASVCCLPLCFYLYAGVGTGLDLLTKLGFLTAEAIRSGIFAILWSTATVRVNRSSPSNLDGPDDDGGGVQGHRAHLGELPGGNPVQNVGYAHRLLGRREGIGFIFVHGESIDLLWDESISKLKILVDEEDSQDSTKTLSINEAYHCFAKLYIKYSIILSDLNSCYESSMQPQKRLDIKSTLEHVICRVISLRHLLVKWCPPNPDVASSGENQAPFPWEYFNLDRELKELCVSPAKLETVTPVFIKEDQTETHQHRNSTIALLIRDAFGSEVKQMDEKSWGVGIATTSDFAFKERSKSENKWAYSLGLKEVTHVIPSDQAAAKIQSIVRGHLTRKNTAIKKRWLDRLVGLRSNSDAAELVELEKYIIGIRERRQKEQQNCRESYDNDLHHLKDVVREEEGFAIQNELREERIRWITEHTISTNMLPDSFEGFYAKDNPPDEKENMTTSANEKQQKGEKIAKNKKGERPADVEEAERPVLSAPQALLDSIKNCTRIYDERWKQRNLGPDRIKTQQHDIEMAKDLIIRGLVKAELTKSVDEKLLSSILKIKATQDASTNNLKSKKNDEKGQDKKAKGEKAGKKEKPLPGAMLPGMQDMTHDAMLGVLVQNGLIFVPEGHRIKNFIGGIENGRPTIPSTDKQERWIPNDPSSFQLRKAAMEYCILPLGSESIRSNLQNDESVRSILFYGHEGSGKTLMVQTIASEVGAMVIKLASSSIGNSFGGDEGAMKLIHMVFAVAREKTYSPVIIYLDDCHEIFMCKSKRTGDGIPTEAEMQRFKKPLLIYKNLALKREDRVLVLGCTNMPESVDVKLLMWKGTPGVKPEKQGFFEHSLYFPLANHADRVMMWRELIRRRISSYDQLQSRIPPALDFAALAHMSDRINCGEISFIVDSVLSENRVHDLPSIPLMEHEFASYFSQEHKLDDTRFLCFTRQVTNLDSLWKSINNPESNNPEKKKKK
ncbi:LOW QUALITY PROTEIN: hypothetical protein ACHAXA_005254, partial [Cyclostephanos tholiformis]